MMIVIIPYFRYRNFNKFPRSGNRIRTNPPVKNLVHINPPCKKNQLQNNSPTINPSANPLKFFFAWGVINADYLP